MTAIDDSAYFVLLPSRETLGVSLEDDDSTIRLFGARIAI